MVENIQRAFYFNDSSTNKKKLFGEAISSAKNGKVLYILREELNELPELSQDLSSVNRHYMKMISFLYTKSMESLIESVSTLPDWQNVPHTIILEDLNGYCGKNLQNACGAVAMLIDAARSCSSVLNIPTKLVISVTRGATGDECCTLLEELYVGQVGIGDSGGYIDSRLYFGIGQLYLSVFLT